MIACTIFCIMSYPRNYFHSVCYSLLTYEDRESIAKLIVEAYTWLTLSFSELEVSAKDLREKKHNDNDRLCE